MTRSVPRFRRPVRFRFSLWRLAAVFLSLSAVSAQENVGIRAPEGFKVSLYAGDDLAHDIYSMTLDSHGRVVVAGAGYVKTLHDDDGDGQADRATLFSEYPKSGAHGMLFDGNTLYATGDSGILKLVDEDGDGRAGGDPERWVDGLRHQEHGCNGIVRGPDGWIYVICGNDAGVTSKFATTADSPVTRPNCGAILRFSPDGKESEILAHGFRNPYDLCFHPQGNMFTVDADGERDHHLPWYSPNRLFDVAIGMHHGWVLTGWQWSWNRPASYFDNVERCAEIGRGSPTGMLCYRHTQFPPKYRGGIFSACWTLGRIYHYPLTPRGSTFDGKVEIFLETTGEVGFAPVDMAVSPDGDMFVAIGGRRTRGSVFKVSYVGPTSDARREPTNALERVLDAPQPLDAWSREKWLPQARKFTQEEFEAAALDDVLLDEWRMRAIEIVTELHSDISRKTARILLNDDAPRVAARTAWSLGRFSNSEKTAELLAGATKSNSALVQRVTWESLAATKPRKAGPISASWGPLEDRRARAARILAVTKGWAGDDEGFEERFKGSLSTDTAWLAHYQDQSKPPPSVGTGGLAIPLHRVGVSSSLTSLTGRSLQEQHELLRLIILGLGDVSVDPADEEKLAGYASPMKLRRLLTNRKGEVRVAYDLARGIAPNLTKFLPEAHDSLRPEMARILAIIEDPEGAGAIEPISEWLSSDSSPTDDIHYLMCLSRIPGKRSDAARANVAAGIARLDGKMKARGWYPSRNWPDRVGETFAALARHDAELPQAVMEHDAFKSPSQAFLFTCLSPDHQAAAARKLLKSAGETDDEDEARWTTELVTLVAALPPQESLPALRGAWDDFALRDAVLLQLAKSPDAADRERFGESLASIDPNVVEKAAAALKQLEIEPAEGDWLALMQSLRQACSAPPAKSARQALVALAEQWSDQVIEIKEKNDDLLASYQPWFDWFAEAHPHLSVKLTELSGDAASWKERLAAVDWSIGDVDRGKQAYEKRSCVKCHAGTSPLGPDLAGAAGRFSRDDLFATIIDPGKDVAPLYQATQIVTGSGKVFHGLIVYESPDGTLLTTGPDTTIRIAGDEIVSMRKSRLSLMPTGLLANATDEELADLYAYLQTLRGKK